MSKPWVLIVEDREIQRLELEEALARRDFAVKSAGDVATARALANELGENLGVMLLDMRLEDAQSPETTGANLGLEVVKSRQNRPQFLMHSGYPEQGYYELALKLGAAAYLKKTGDLLSVIRHIRVLQMRYLLSLHHPDSSGKMKFIAQTSATRNEALSRFCREILYPVVEGSLGAPFVFLLSNAAGTQFLSGSDDDYPTGFHPAYHAIAARAFGESGEKQPYVLSGSERFQQGDAEQGLIFRKLQNAAFVPLAEYEGNRLLMGILREDFNEPHSKYPEDPEALGLVIHHHFRGPFMSRMLGLLTLWAESGERRRALLTATSQFCLYVGQEQSELLREIQISEEDNRPGKPLALLRALADDLYEAGYLLASLHEQLTDEAKNPVPKEKVSVADQAQHAWDQICDQMALDRNALDIVGNGWVFGNTEDLQFAISRVLTWLAQRFPETAREHGLEIRLRFHQKEDGLEIVFEDRSRRLPAALRGQLFLPFSQTGIRKPYQDRNMKRPGLHLPLYMAKMLVELRNAGNLLDRTEEMEGEVGHRLVMVFPGHNEPPA